MIIFDTVTFKNFLSVGEKEVSIKLSENSSTLITGPNGAGKSTILDSLSFVLFGKAQRKIKKDKLVNAINSRECLASITFSKNKDKYKIIRGIAPSIFEIYKNGKLINQNSHNRDYQKYLEDDILGMNHASFHQIVVLASANFIPFMELRPCQRREVVEKLLCSSIFTVMWDIVKQKSTQNVTREYDQSQKKSVLNTEHQEKKRYLKQLEKILAENRNKLRGEIEVLKQKQKVVSDKINRVDLDNLVKDLELKADEHSEIRSRFRELDRKLSEKQFDYKSIKKTKEFFNNANTCPSCTQPITEALKQDKIANIESDIKVLMQESKKINDSLKKVKQEQTSIETLIQSLNTRIQEIKDYLKEISFYNNQIDELENRDSISSTEIIVESVKKEIDKLEAIIPTIEDEYKKLLIEKRHLDALYSVFQDSGIKSEILKRYLPIINRVVNEYLDNLDFFGVFSIDENFDETIRANHRDDFSYFSFSEGEKTKISLAILFAWREISRLKNAVNTNLLFLDEVLDSSLDSTAIDNVFKILRKAKNTNFFVISHRFGNTGDEAELFDAHLSFQKTGHFTEVKKLF